MKRFYLATALVTATAMPAAAAEPARTEIPVSDEKTQQLLARAVISLAGVERAQASILELLEEIKQLQQQQQKSQAGEQPR